MSDTVASSASITVCDTPGCGKPSKLRCPNCVKSNVKAGSNFCSQVKTQGYFTMNFNNNKNKHSLRHIVHE